MQTCDVAVIGAGMVGAACAYELASAGLRVALVEPSDVVAGATNLGYGNMAILDEKPGQFALTRYGLALWDRLVEWLPAECEYRKCGTVWLALDDDQMEEAARRAEFFNRQGVEAALLDERQVTELEPGLRAGMAGGLYVSGDSCLQAGRTAEYLFLLAQKRGALHVKQKALALLEHEVKLEDGTLYAGSIVNAAGNEARALTPGLALKHSKGHVLVVETQERCALHQISELGTEQRDGVDGTVRFEARQNAAHGRQASEVWIGSSYQETENAASLAVEPKIVATLLRRAIEMSPAIGQAKPLRSWTGMRATTADGLPLIGRVGGVEGLFAATGHDSYGATTALATGRLIADEILLRTPEIDPAPYMADRFKGMNS